MRQLVLLGLWSLLLLSCGAGRLGAADPSASPPEPTDGELRANYGEEIATGVEDIRDKRKAALAAPTSLEAADAYADALIAGLSVNYAQIARIDWRRYLKDATDLIASATLGHEGDAERVANALTKRATFQVTLGDAASGTATLRDAFAKAHTFATGLGMVQVNLHDKNSHDAQALCETTRPLAKKDDDVYSLMSECLKLNHGEPPQQTLPWASREDWALYQQRSHEKMERNLARREAEAAADRDTREAAPQSPSEPERARGRDAPRAPAGPRRASFTIRNSCNKTVKLFYGETPKYGSGHTDSLSANSSHSDSQQEGQMIWIIDEHENGIGTYTVSANVHEVVITPSCTSFMAR